MRVIRPADRDATARRRVLWNAALALAAGAVATAVVLLLPLSAAAAGLLALTAAAGWALGAVWLRRGLRRGGLELAEELAELLGGILDDAYTLILTPRLPRVGSDLHALLVGPAGVRILTARPWRGRYRVRGRGWQYDTRGRMGWIACRTNPSLDAVALRNRVQRWADELHLANLPIEAAVAFPRGYSEIVLEEPADDIITADNAPWWAQRVGRVQRLDAQRATRFVAAVLEAGEGRGAASRADAPLAG